MLSIKHEVDKKTGVLHPGGMYYLCSTFSLNDVCDALRNQSKPLSTIRGAVPQSRNGLSNANRARSGDMTEDLFWSVLNSLNPHNAVDFKI